MLDDKYIVTPNGIPVVTFYSLFNFKDNKFKNPYGIQEGEFIAFTHFHHHKDFELIYFNSGCGEFHVAGNKYNFEAGDVAIINPYDTHYGKIKRAQDCFSYYCIDFDVSFLNDYFAYSRFTDSLISEELKFTRFIKKKDSGQIGASIKKIHSAYEKQHPGWELEGKAYIMLIFSFLIKNNMIHDHKPSKENKFVKEILTYIDNNFHENITSKEAAEHMFYNQSYFCRIFKKNFLCDFAEYLNIYRVRKAETLLQNGVGKISDIAITVGFNNLSYFAKTFKRLTGKLPSHYIKSLKTN